MSGAAAARLLAVLALLALVAPGLRPVEASAAVLAGTQDAHPTVRRLAGGNRAGTAAAIATDGWAHSDTAVLVTGEDHVGALVGAHLAARLDVPVLLGIAGPQDGVSTSSRQRGTDVPPETAAALDALDVAQVWAIDDVAVPTDVEVRRIDGADPADLAAQALTAATTEGPVVLASQTDFPDALSAANLAPANLLLSDPAELSPAAAEAISGMDPDEVVLLGGTAALSDQVAGQVAELGPTVRRISGANRVATSLQAATRTGGPAVLAAAHDFADAVAVVPWAARRTASVLLTPHPALPVGVDTRLRDIDHAEVVIAGGTAAVGNHVDRQAHAALTGAAPPGAAATVRPLAADERQAMTGVSWHPGCPVPLEDLVVVASTHWGFDGNVGQGQLIVHTDVAADVATVLEAAFTARFPIERMEPVRVHDGDDDASMAANNTSAFNCRTVGGTSTWSQHAYGLAVDINPVHNPYVRGSTVEPPAGAAYLDRTDERPGMVVEGGPVVTAFDGLGWGWGGRWQSSSDYQHFSSTGR